MQTIDPDYFFITPEVIPENYLELLESIEIKKELLGEKGKLLKENLEAVSYTHLTLPTKA